MNMIIAIKKRGYKFSRKNFAILRTKFFKLCKMSLPILSLSFLTPLSSKFS